MESLNKDIEKLPISDVKTTENLNPSSVSTAPTTTSISPSHSENLMRRDHESVDDFEHLDPELSPVKETATEPVNLLKDSEPVKKMSSGIIDDVHSLLTDSSPTFPPAPSSDVGKQNLLDMEFEETGPVSNIVESKNNFDDDDLLVNTSEKLADVLEPALLTTPSNLTEINRAATEPVFPSHLDDNADEFEAVRESPPYDMSDKIQFESGIDLSDLMVKDENNKTDDKKEEEIKIEHDDDEIEEEDEKSEEHLPKAKEELEAVYRNEPKHSTLTVDEPEEAQLSDREDDNAFVMAEKEEEQEMEVEKEEEIVPEPDEPEIDVAPVTLPKVTPQPAAAAAVTKPATPTSQEADDEIAACDVLGICAWFNPDTLHPTVGQLVYWRDPKKSGLVFGGVMVVLLSLSVFSLISVVAYLSLAVLTGTIIFRVYKSILQAVQKTEDGHPFKDLLEAEIALTQDKVQEVTELTVAHVNGAVCELRRLFLVEDLVDSIKFGVLLWCLTYVGAWFNGMTLIIIASVGAFTLPKVYENNKAQIDQYLDLVRSKMADVSSKVKAAIPLGKKDKEQ